MTNVWVGCLTLRKKGKGELRAGIQSVQKNDIICVCVCVLYLLHHIVT